MSTTPPLDNCFRSFFVERQVARPLMIVAVLPAFKPEDEAAREQESPSSGGAGGAAA